MVSTKKGIFCHLMGREGVPSFYHILGDKCFVGLSDHPPGYGFGLLELCLLCLQPPDKEKYHQCKIFSVGSVIIFSSDRSSGSSSVCVCVHLSVRHF